MKLKKLQRLLKKIERCLNRHPVITLWAVVVVCFLLIISRKYHDFRHPQFWAEDGLVWFAQAHGEGFLHTILQPYSGTFSVMTRLVGSIAAAFPLRYGPLLFVSASLGCQLLPVFLINSSRLRLATKYRLIAIIFSLLYAGVPNAREVFLNLANVQWHLGVAAFLVLVASSPKTRTWKIFDPLLLLLTGMTGPVGMALVPVALIIYYRKRLPSNLRNLLVLLLATLAQLVSLFIIEPGQRSGYQTYATLTKAVEMFTGQVVTGGLFGQAKVDWLYSNIFLLYLVFFAALAIIIYAVRRGPDWLKYANLFSLTIILLTLMSQKPLKGVDVWALLTQPGVGQRYWYIPVLVWIATVLWVVCGRTFKPLRLLCTVLLVCLVAYGIPQSWFLPTLPDMHYQYYVRKFNASKAGQRTTFYINPSGWSFPITKK